ncbi:hypothetical protein Krad_2412 [Kineococcus radiotolerans SRS30216 = ATCC BAA-149]|uniref:Uncharacterized protein n=2 Tax=Kineococcus radiotolerans TaxID=131568 RepID=A6WAQ3_KINRD|nr:hypothetical protein Krad_2412 [Kineococcus radiotolerans SRS30216 = ATCC BAA-149]
MQPMRKDHRMSSSTSTPHLTARALGGASLVVLCAALLFFGPSLKASLRDAGHEDLAFLSWPVSRIAFGAGLAGGTWLMATAWIAWRTRGGTEAA